MKEITFFCILCFYVSFSRSAENNTIDFLELEQKNVFLNLENSELRLNYSNVALEYAKLQKEHYETRQKLNKMENHYTTLNSNCSVLTDQITTLVDGLQTLSENIEPLKPKHYQRDLPKNCAEASKGKSGIYTIAVPFSNLEPFEVVCDTDIHFGNWLVIQRRMDGSVDFHRPWLEYKKGFGTLEGEFFIGLDRLHALTTYLPHELLIVMTDFEEQTQYIKYKDFKIGSEQELFVLEELGEPNGNSSDSLRIYKGNIFLTYDIENKNHYNNEQYSEIRNCARKLLGGWWHSICKRKSDDYRYSNSNGGSNLNGRYLNGRYISDYQYGITWEGFHSDFYSLKFVQMMIQPKKDYQS